MARKTVFMKDQLLEKTIDFIKEKGIKRMRARELCKYIGCSTQPIFKNFGSMKNLKNEAKNYIKNYYKNFMEEIVDKNAYLYSTNYSYALFALQEPNLFETLFIDDIGKSKTIDDVLKTDDDVDIIESIPNQYKISKKQSERLYRDVKFYAHGLSCQIVFNNLSLKKEDVGLLIKNIIKNLIKQI